ncbi:MAG: ABC transporter ATP-binding protein [Candidatus Bipolaricaulota bacterium]|nr:ABC transporter ATP-binding protein [Candidatus Bipolaricaulota bacterium]MDW8126871.1 ABC transporter ATP-binding protein [Candidatus Bipolaricaulota bacterium]
MASVTVRNLFVSYHRGRTVAVDHVSFSVGDGEFCVLLGPSGCGKTTILQCIAGLIRPGAGEIVIGDKVVTSAEKNIFVRPQDRNIAMVFQEYALYPNLTVRENLAFPLECQGLPRKEIETRVQSVAEMLGITELLNRRPAQLSGGQRQRVALGRALVRQPTVFLLDEPLGNLDAQLRVQVRYELKRIQRQLHATMIYVTHDQTEALTLADQIVLLKNGKIEQKGSPQELYEKPSNLFVASFIGSPPMNLVEGNVMPQEGAMWVDAGVFKVRVEALQLGKSLAPNTKVMLGIRPADISGRPSSPTDLRISATVDLLEPMGDSAVLHALSAGFKITAKWEGSLLRPGEAVTLFVNPSKIHVFTLPDGGNVPKALAGAAGLEGRASL